jgi:hypothetical protein
MAKGKEELIGRAVVDADFRKRLLADPDGTIAAEGYEIDDELLAQIKSVDAAAAEAATADLDAAFADRKAAT